MEKLSYNVPKEEKPMMMMLCVPLLAGVGRVDCAAPMILDVSCP